MSQIAKMEVQVEINSEANEVYDIFLRKGYLMPKICPDKIKNIELLAGDWNAVGSVKLWTFVPGTSESAKEELEAVDELNKSVTFRVLDGEILKYYNSLKSTVQVKAKNNNKGSLVKWTLEYEKPNESVPDPDKYLEFVATVAKDVDAYLLRA